MTFDHAVMPRALPAWIVLVAALAAAPPAVAADRLLVAANGIWRFDDSGRDLGTSWRLPGFDDSTWAWGTAPLGFGRERSDVDPTFPIGTMVGSGPNAGERIITTYFRLRFTVPEVAPGATVIAHLHVDDAVVVYLNGVEAFRSGFDAGVLVRFSTRAAMRTGRVTVELPSRLLRTGANLLAVEVHQEHERSPDLWFALQLSLADARMAAASD